MLYEEIEILREKDTQVSERYIQATQDRDAQYQILVKERELLHQREEVLEAALEEAIDVMQQVNEQSEQKMTWQRKQELKETEQVKVENAALVEKLAAEREVNARELE